jgi:hypothetical protein
VICHGSDSRVIHCLTIITRTKHSQYRSAFRERPIEAVAASFVRPNNSKSARTRFQNVVSRFTFSVLKWTAIASIYILPRTAPIQAASSFRQRTYPR